MPCGPAGVKTATRPSSKMDAAIVRRYRLAFGRVVQRVGRLGERVSLLPELVADHRIQVCHVGGHRLQPRIATSGSQEGGDRVLADVEGADIATWADVAQEPQRLRPGAAADVEDLLAWSHGEALHVPVGEVRRLVAPVEVQPRIETGRAGRPHPDVTAVDVLQDMRSTLPVVARVSKTSAQHSSLRMANIPSSYATVLPRSAGRASRRIVDQPGDPVAAQPGVPQCGVRPRSPLPRRGPAPRTQRIRRKA